MKLLRKEELLTTKSGNITKSTDTETEAICHPMKAKLDRVECRAAKNFIQYRDPREVKLCTQGKDCEQPFVGAVQRLSKKSVKALESSSYDFYRLSLTPKLRRRRVEILCAAQVQGCVVSATMDWDQSERGYSEVIGNSHSINSSSTRKSLFVLLKSYNS